MSTIRQEIIESQKIRAEFIKWKLLIVAALAAAAIGINVPNVAIKTYLILVLIPPSCLYVDLLCAHSKLRIMVIGSFKRSTFRKDGCDAECEYERFAKECTKAGIFSLEDYVLSIFTNACSLLITFIGFIISFGCSANIGLLFQIEGAKCGNFDIFPGLPFIASGLLVLCFSQYAKRLIKQRLDAIEVVEDVSKLTASEIAVAQSKRRGLF